MRDDTNDGRAVACWILPDGSVTQRLADAMTHGMDSPMNAIAIPRTALTPDAIPAAVVEVALNGALDHVADERAILKVKQLVRDMVSAALRAWPRTDDTTEARDG